MCWYLWEFSFYFKFWFRKMESSRLGVGTSFKSDLLMFDKPKYKSTHWCKKPFIVYLYDLTSCKVGDVEKCILRSCLWCPNFCVSSVAKSIDGCVTVAAMVPDVSASVIDLGLCFVFPFGVCRASWSRSLFVYLTSESRTSLEEKLVRITQSLLKFW